MESVPSRRSRIGSRYRHSAQEITQSKESKRTESAEKEGETDEPLLLREQKGRVIMGRAHRMFHRRQAESASNVLTMVVEVVATVDASGHVIAEETNTPSLPQVPAEPTVPLPSVPAVPPFPSDLTVPAYPFPSGVPTAQIPLTTSQPTASSPFPTSSGIASVFAQSMVPSLGFNSSIPSTIALSSFLSVSNSTSSTSVSLSTSSASSSSSLASSSFHSSSSTISSNSQTPTTSYPASSHSAVGGVPGAPATAAPSPAGTTAPAASSKSTDNNTIGTPGVVGSVIGSLAGAALIFALLLFLINRHKQNKRRGVLALPGNDTSDNQPLPDPSNQQMTTRSSFVPAGAAAFFNRFSGASRSTVDTNATGERGFQRISGRKLPSAFSEGMTSEQFARGEGALSGSSFYRDDHGIYGGPGVVPKELGKDAGEASTSGAMGTQERIMPGPARTPTIHHPQDAPPFGTSRNGGSDFSPPHTPTALAPRPTLGRSHPSHDGSRGSRFTEDV